MTARRSPRGDQVTIEGEVPFHDVDGQRIVWHGHYLKYLELARTAWLRSLGSDIEDIEAAGYNLVVIETRIRHSFPLRYGERFEVRSWCTDTEHRIRIAYEIWNLTHDRRSARAHTILATTDEQGKLLYDTPEAIRRLLPP